MGQLPRSGRLEAEILEASWLTLVEPSRLNLRVGSTSCVAWRLGARESLRLCE